MAQFVGGGFMKTKRKVATPPRRTGAPFLRGIAGLPEKIDPTKYPFSIRAFSRGIDLAFRSKVTFLVGENGSGKSTLLEAIAECCGFNPEGGNRDHHRAVFAERSPLAQALRLSWLPKVTEGFFMRAESFYNFATYIEHVSDLRAYGGRSLHEQSHGEAFISLFASGSSSICSKPLKTGKPIPDLRVLPTAADYRAAGPSK